MSSRGSVRITNLDFKKTDLMPTVVQEAKSKEVLMLAYSNEESLEKTMETGYAHYWSRSRKSLWMKGETSGHVQRMVQILVDCDRDTLLFKVEQSGPACHTGEATCFHSELKSRLFHCEKAQ